MLRMCLIIMCLLGKTIALACAGLMLDTILATAAVAEVYYVGTTGSNRYSCEQAKNPATPKLTLGEGVACLRGGDTLVIGAGTYTDTAFGDYGDVRIPDGSADSYTVIQAAPGETVVIKPDTCSSGGDVFSFYSKSYIVLQGFTVDATNCPSIGMQGIRLADDTHHILMQDLEIQNSLSNGIGFQSPQISDCTIRGVKIHDYGSSHAYGVYVQGSRITVESSEIYDGFGWGIHIYSGGGDPMYNNRWC
jgi:hypothetical protein